MDENQEKPEEVKAHEEAPKEEKIEATHDNEEAAEKVAPALSGEKEKQKELPKLNEEVFMVGDEIELEGCKFEIAEVSGLKLVLKRVDIK